LNDRSRKEKEETSTHYLRETRKVHDSKEKASLTLTRTKGGNSGASYSFNKIIRRSSVREATWNFYFAKEERIAAMHKLAREAMFRKRTVREREGGKKNGLRRFPNPPS